MDTKLKKLKIIISFTVFFISVSLLLYGLLGLLYSISANRRYTGDQISEAFLNDYQKTSQFKDYINERFSDFLAMATGAPVWGYYWYDPYPDSSENVIRSEEYSELVQGSGYWGTTEYWGDDWSDYASPEESRKSAQRMHEYLEKDKNLLYTISYDGKVLYSNTEGLTLDGKADIMPEGYNFLLYFDGSTVTITKDGEQLDVYGNGYYDETCDWYVPGYQNFTLDEDMQKASISMAIAQTPVPYTYGIYGRGDYQQSDNTLYWLQYHKNQLHQQILFQLSCLAAGVVLLLISILSHKDKLLADQAIARINNKLLLEVKIILLLFIPAGAVLLSSNAYSGMFENMQMISWELEQETLYMGDTAACNYYPNQMISELLYGILSNPVILVLLFWCLYLIVNDIRYNKSPWKHSLCCRMISVFQTKELKLPVSKRLVHRYLPLCFCSLIYCVAGILIIAYTDWSSFIYPAVMFFLLLSGLIALTALQFHYIRKAKAFAGEIELLSDRIMAIKSGDYESSPKLPPESELSELLDELDDISQGMAKAIEEQMKSQCMKVELLTNISHDIKTPLTSIISYVEFLKKEEDLPPHAKDYIHILDEKSQRLKNMVQDVFSVSKAVAGQLPVHIEALDLVKLLHQTIADMDEQIQQSSVTLKKDFPAEALLIQADGQRMYRVFQNLIQNALKYSLDGSRIYLTIHTDGTIASASIKNTSKSEVNLNKDFTERFVRGDESRTDGGSGLGLSIAQSFTEACGGQFQLEVIADLFVVTVSFPISETA